MLNRERWERERLERDAQLRSRKRASERRASHMASRFYNSHDVDIPRKSCTYVRVCRSDTVLGESRMHLAGAFRSLDVRERRTRESCVSLRQRIPRGKSAALLSAHNFAWFDFSNEQKASLTRSRDPLCRPVSSINGPRSIQRDQY